MEILVVILIVGLVIGYTSLMGGLVVSCFWSWFLLPVFPELPVITYAQAVGLMFFISLFKYSGKKTEKDDDGTNMTMMFLNPILLLIVGAIVHAFIQ